MARRKQLSNGVQVDWASLLAKYRSDNKLGQKELAFRLGVTQFTISRWENGGEVRFDKQKEILALLRMSADPGLELRLRDTVDYADGFMTLLGPRFELLRTSPKHQQFSNIDLTEHIGLPSQRLWAPEMAELMERIGDNEGYRGRRITCLTMMQELVRYPGEPGYIPNIRRFTLGSTITWGPPEAPVGYLTQVRIVEGGEPMPPMVRIGNGEMMPLSQAL
jgi:transcriptional regulator with XRE-family HTH domain